MNRPAAPPCARQSLASCNYKATEPGARRFPRRGPRSLLSKMRRVLPKRCRALPGAASGESEASAPIDSLNILPQHFDSIDSEFVEPDNIIEAPIPVEAKRVRPGLPSSTFLKTMIVQGFPSLKPGAVPLVLSLTSKLLSNVKRLASRVSRE